MHPLRHAIMTGALSWGLAIALLLMLATIMGQFGLLPGMAGGSPRSH